MTLCLVCGVLLVQLELSGHFITAVTPIHYTHPDNSFCTLISSTQENLCLFPAALSIYLSGLVTAIPVFWNPNAIPFCLTTDLLLYDLLSWLLIHLPSTFFLDILFSFFPLVSTQLILVVSPLASF